MQGKNNNDNKIFLKLKFQAFLFSFLFLYGKQRKTVDTGRLSSVLTRNSYITAHFAYARMRSFTSPESIM